MRLGHFMSKIVKIAHNFRKLGKIVMVFWGVLGSFPAVGPDLPPCSSLVSQEKPAGLSQGENSPRKFMNERVWLATSDVTSQPVQRKFGYLTEALRNIHGA